MKKFLSLFIFVITLLAVLFLFSGCGSWLRVQEEEIYTQTINDFFSALDESDSDAIFLLFSKEVQNKDTDLKNQIRKLITIYPRDTSKIMFDGLLGGSYSDELGMSTSIAYATFPVISNGEYYWAYIELIYEDDINPNNIGLNRVFFYTADEYSIFFNDETLENPTDIGLLVYADQKLDLEVRCIDKKPYEFTPIERNLKLSEIEDFLNSNTYWSDFIMNFGQPNAKGTSHYFYYEIQESNDNLFYLEVGVNEEIDKIIYVNLVDELKYIRTVLEEK